MEVISSLRLYRRGKAADVKRYLIPRQVKENGITEEIITISDEAVKVVIAKYTREAGLRNLEREIGSICRKVARRIAEGEDQHFVVNAVIRSEIPRTPQLPAGSGDGEE